MSSTDEPFSPYGCGGSRLEAFKQLHCSTLWEPTRLTSPYCVLSASGVQDDFYTSCLSWGKENIAFALRHDLLLFHPGQPRRRVASAHFGGPTSFGHNSERRGPLGGNSGEHHETVNGTQLSYPSAVAMSRFSDSVCFAGMRNGGASIYESRGDGALVRTGNFDMPLSPHDELNALLHESWGAGASTSGTVSRTEALQRLSALSHTVTSISCMATSSAHPWVAAVGTSGRGLLTVDARRQRFCMHFGCSSLCPCLSGGSAGRCSVQARHHPSSLHAAASYLLMADRLCSAAWNANGSLVATGSGSGIVTIWSLSNSREPVQTIVVKPGTSLKALSFHPTKPYELLVGGAAGDGGLRIYDISSATPRVAWLAPTTAPATQALYSPDGAYVVSGHGENEPPRSGLPAPDRSRRASYTTSSIAPSETNFFLSADATWGEESGAKKSMLLDSVSPESSISSHTQGPHWERPVPSMERETWRRLQREGVPCEWIPPAVPDRSNASQRSWKAPSYALLVWRKATHYRGSLVVEEVLDCCERDGLTSSKLSNSGPLPLQPQYVLPGHRSRILHIAAPFLNESNAGCVASVAGGEDDTIRFWRVFRPASAEMGGVPSGRNTVPTCTLGESTMHAEITQLR